MSYFYAGIKITVRRQTEKESALNPPKPTREIDMCYAIFALLIALLFFYSDAIVQEYALSIHLQNDTWMTVALGWEMIQVLWPLLLLATVIGSALTYLVPRLLNRNAKNSQ